MFSTRSRSILKPAMLIATAACVGTSALMLVQPIAATAQGVPKEAREFQAKAPEVPAEIWKSFTEGLEKEDATRAARAMSRAAVEPAVAALASSQAVELVSENFLRNLIQSWNPTIRVTPFQEAFLQHGEVEDNSGNGTSVMCFYMEVSDVRNGESMTYVIPAKLLEPYSFEFIQSIVLLHPLNRRVAAVTYDSAITSACRELCELAKVDYAIGDSDNAPSITTSLRNRTISESLVILASQCGWQVMVEQEHVRELTLYQPGNPKLDPITHLNEDISMDTILESYRNRDYLNVVEKASPQITDHMTALQYELRRKERDIESAQTVVRIRPWK